MDDSKYSILEHLGELRSRVVNAMLGVALAMCVTFYYSEALLAWLRKPMLATFGDNAHFIVLVPHEYFVTQMKTALVFGILLASPWIFYQMWRFLAPGLYQTEQKMVIGSSLLAGLLFVCGALFGYTFVFPPMFSFFVGTLPADVEGAYSVGMLFGFATNMLLAFGMVFETPIAVLMLVKMNLIELKTLRHGRRYWAVIAFIAAAIITPTPDPVTQSMMALPMIFLYEVGLFGARFLGSNPSIPAE